MSRCGGDDPSAAPKCAVLCTNDCSQAALADCTIMLHVVHTRLPAVSALRLGPTCAAVEMKARNESNSCSWCTFCCVWRAKSWRAGQPDPHEKTILERLVYAYITTYRTSEGARKTPRAFPKVSGAAGAAQRVALVGAPYR